MPARHGCAWSPGRCGCINRPKNVLIFVPILAAHRAAPLTELRAAVAFAAFSFGASSVYLLNGLIDLPHGRLHPSKRRRPFASEVLPLSSVPMLINGADARWWPVLFGLAGLTAACAAFDAATGFFSAYRRDILFMIRVNRGQGVYALGYTACRNWAPLAVGAGIAVLALHDLRRGGVPAQARAPIWQSLQPQALAVDLLLLGAAWAVESQSTGGIGPVAAAAVLLHPDSARQGGQRLVATTLFGAALLLPMLDVAVFRMVTITQRERAGSTDHGFSAMAPGIRVPAPTLAAPSRYLAGADGTFLSTWVLSAGGEPTIPMVFQPVLDAEFEPHKLNACWTFYNRRPAAPP